ncbi:hypothetical protein [Magnetospirillum fulvum]|uniref:Uncharacterized protein n=1 Tax=Magnetospirillum fulvum MGU-K5 TaxID=1316936 RepID=S9SA29_MAGFU|nr:hypothetical protein [Magnetospirillum fulvum]EPY00933.1 hypothetical protein K678_13643 [Magnetospirillum fulvum MGU-K5]
MIPDHEHLCAVCGAWGPYGRRNPRKVDGAYVWYCADHRPAAKAAVVEKLSSPAPVAAGVPAPKQGSLW